MLGTDPKGDSIYQNNGVKMHFIFKQTIQCKFFSILAHLILTQNQLILMDITSYISQSEHAKMDIHCFVKLY